MRNRLISVCIVVILVFNSYGCAQTAEDTLAAEGETVEAEYTKTEDKEETGIADTEWESAKTAIYGREHGQDEIENGLMTDVSEQEEQAGQGQRQVYIQPDMPEPFIEVLKQYEAEAKLGIYSYSLTDLTGDGFPELIMGRDSDIGADYLYAVYYYSETEGIKMVDTTRYFDMSLYEGGIIEYISSGVDYTITYLQFQEETESWELADRIILDWDSEGNSENYYRGVKTADFSDPDNEPMSEEEYHAIIEKYTAKPVKLEWTSLFCDEEPADGYFFPQGDEIYFIRAEEAQSEYQTVEEILNVAALVCNEDGKEDALDEDERGWHEFILAEGDRREYHLYSTMVETGYYEHFYWEKGKGLVTYESGYGALADGIEMYLMETP